MSMTKTKTRNAGFLRAGLDLCDTGCGASARVRVENKKGHDLLFCGHHFDKFEANLRAWAYGIHDDRPLTAAWQ